MTEQHTPGPWEHFSACEVTANDPAGESSHVLIAYTYESPNPQADALLIAAAPELLAALKEQVAECFDDDPCDMCARHMALIARSEGSGNG